MKKILIKFGTVSIVGVPLIAAVACGTNNVDTGDSPFGIPPRPEFDDHEQSTIDNYKLALIESFDGYVTIGSEMPVDTSTIIATTTVVGAHAAALLLNVDLMLLGGREDVTQSVIIPPIPPTDHHLPETIGTHIQALVALFTGSFQSRTLIDTSSISAATTPTEATLAAEALALNYESAGGDDLSNATFPDALFDDHSQSAIDAYILSLVSDFSGRYSARTLIDDQTIHSATTATDARDAAALLVKDYSSTDGDDLTGVISIPSLPSFDGHTPSAIAAHKVELKAEFAGKYASRTHIDITTVIESTGKTASLEAALAIATTDFSYQGGDNLPNTTLAADLNAAPTNGNLHFYQVRLFNILYEYYEAREEVDADVIDVGSTVDEARAIAETLKDDHSEVNGDDLTTIALPLAPAFDDLTLSGLDNFKTQLHDLFDGYYMARTEVETTTIENALTIMAATSAAEALKISYLDDHGEDLRDLVLSPVPPFDDFLANGLEDYKDDLISVFDSMYQSRTEIDVSALEAAATVSEAVTEAQALAVSFVGDGGDDMSGVAFPVEPPFDSIEDLPLYKTNLTALFSGYFESDGVTPIDTSLIGGAANASAAHSEAQFLKDAGVFEQDQSLIENANLPEQEPGEVHNENTIELYRTEVKALFAGLDIDLSVLDEATTIEFIFAAALLLIFENGL